MLDPHLFIAVWWRLIRPYLDLIWVGDSFSSPSWFKSNNTLYKSLLLANENPRQCFFETVQSRGKKWLQFPWRNEFEANLLRRNTLCKIQAVRFQQRDPDHPGYVPQRFNLTQCINDGFRRSTPPQNHQRVVSMKSSTDCFNLLIETINWRFCGGADFLKPCN